MNEKEIAEASSFALVELALKNPDHQPKVVETLVSWANYGPAGGEISQSASRAIYRFFSELVNIEREIPPEVLVFLATRLGNLSKVRADKAAATLGLTSGERGRKSLRSTQETKDKYARIASLAAYLRMVNEHTAWPEIDEDLGELTGLSDRTIREARSSTPAQNLESIANEHEFRQKLNLFAKMYSRKESGS